MPSDRDPGPLVQAPAMHDLTFKVFGWVAIALVALFAGIGAADTGFAIHMGIVAVAALLTAWVTMQRADYAVLTGLAPAELLDRSRYDDNVIRLGVLATMFWGIPHGGEVRLLGLSIVHRARGHGLSARDHRKPRISILAGARRR